MVKLKVHSLQKACDRYWTSQYPKTYLEDLKQSSALYIQQMKTDFGFHIYMSSQVGLFAKADLGSHIICIKCGAKHEHFSCFHSSCQWGLRSKSTLNIKCFRLWQEYCKRPEVYNVHKEGVNFHQITEALWHLLCLYSKF